MSAATTGHVRVTQVRSSVRVRAWISRTTAGKIGRAHV